MKLLTRIHQQAAGSTAWSWEHSFLPIEGDGENQYMQRRSKHNTPAIYSMEDLTDGRRLSQQEARYKLFQWQILCSPESSTDMRLIRTWSNFWGDREGVCNCRPRRLLTAPIVCPYSVTSSKIMSENLYTAVYIHMFEKSDLHWTVSEDAKGW